MEYQRTGKISRRPDRLMNTCDPYTGNWDEHLIDTHQIKAMFEREGFVVQIRSGYYTFSPHPLTQLCRYALNSLVCLFERKGIILAPSYLVYALGCPACTSE